MSVVLITVYMRCGPDSGQCIRISDRCNKIVDCVNGWDEDASNCHSEEEQSMFVTPRKQLLSSRLHTTSVFTKTEKLCPEYSWCLLLVNVHVCMQRYMHMYISVNNGNGLNRSCRGRDFDTWRKLDSLRRVWWSRRFQRSGLSLHGLVQRNQHHWRQGRLWRLQRIYPVSITLHFTTSPACTLCTVFVQLYSCVMNCIKPFA